MKTAHELYPSYVEDEKNGYFYGPGDYQPIIENLGTVLIQVDDQYYQGDTRVIYLKDNKYGYLNFGWGSCSGCDVLQGCGNMADIQELMDGMNESIKWFDSLADLKEYFKSKDWELEYSCNDEGQKEFIEQVMQYENP